MSYNITHPFKSEAALPAVFHNRGNEPRRLRRVPLFRCLIDSPDCVEAEFASAEMLNTPLTERGRLRIVQTGYIKESGQRGKEFQRLSIVSYTAAVASVSPSKRKFKSSILIAALTLGLFSSGTGVAQATAQEEPNAKPSAAASNGKLAKPLEQNSNAGMLAMAESSTSTLTPPATATHIGDVASTGFGQLDQQSLQVMSYIQKYNRQLAPDEAVGFARAIVQFGSQYGVDYRLLTSIIATESSFRRNAISSSGAIGMGQLKPDTARWLGVMNPYDPVDNIAGTARFLAWLVHRYNGKLEYAISAYYQGPGHVDRKGISPVCIPYLQKVNRALGGLL